MVSSPICSELCVLHVILTHLAAHAAIHLAVSGALPRGIPKASFNSGNLTVPFDRHSKALISAIASTADSHTPQSSLQTQQRQLSKLSPFFSLLRLLWPTFADSLLSTAAAKTAAKSDNPPKFRIRACTALAAHSPPSSKSQRAHDPIGRSPPRQCSLAGG
jgi:hypothetical protein